MKSVLVLIAAISLAPGVEACSVCVTKPLKVAFQDSQYFFVGKVTRQQPWSVTLEVLEQFKGEPVRELTLRTSNSCSISQFEHGASYLVEATPDGEGLYAYLCSHTGLVNSPTTARKLQLVKRRASWWKSCFSRASMYRLRGFLGPRVGG